MSNKRIVQIADLPTDGSVRDLHNLTYKVLLQYPDAMIEYADEYYDDRTLCVTIQVDKTDLDREIDENEEQLRILNLNSSFENEVVIRQDTPIPPEVLAPYHEDKTQTYSLHLSGRLLVRMLSWEEIEQKRSEVDSKRLTLQVARRLLLDRQIEQDKVYKVL